MRFERLRLENYRCFENTDVEFESGITIVHGVNGTGKSSLLEACFFALYGSDALRESNSNLGDVITNDAEETSVTLWFEHNGKGYRVHRAIRRANERGEQRKVELELPSETLTGARSVDAEIESLLRMDAESFRNCAYIRQGDVNALIDASPGRREDIIDNLLQLGKLETFRERASDARVGVGRVRDTKSGALEDLGSLIEEKEAKNLPNKLEGVKQNLETIAGDIEAAETEYNEVEEEQETAQSVLDDQEDLQEELSELNDEIDTLQDKIDSSETDQEELTTEIDELETRTESLEEEIKTHLSGDTLDIGPETELDTIKSVSDEVDSELTDLNSQIDTAQLKAENANENRDTLLSEAEAATQKAESRREEAASLERSLDGDSQDELERLQEKLASIDEKILDQKSTFDNTPVDFGDAEELVDSHRDEREELRGEKNDAEASIKATQQRIQKTEQLLEEGKCPECGQDVGDSPHVETVEDDREKLEELTERRDELTQKLDDLNGRIDTAEILVQIESNVDKLVDQHENTKALIKKQKESIKNQKEQIEDYREQAGEFETTAENKRKQAVEAKNSAEEATDTIASLKDKRTTLVDQSDSLQDALDSYSTKEDLETERSSLVQERNHQKELTEERQSQLSGKKADRDDLQKQVDEDAIEQARQQVDETATKLSSLETKIDDLEDQQASLQNKKGSITQEIQTLNEYRTRQSSLKDQVEALDSLYDEVEDYQQMYSTLRADLRQRNVAHLEKLVNEIFDLIYQNDAYDRIELDGSYQATFYEKSGNKLDPGKLSGGESALFNLSLRCAIYQLLIEGVEGTPPMPPLILDEPTAHLDDGHISKVSAVVERMRNIGVEQTIVVSHTETIIDSADQRIEVAQRPAANRSDVSTSSGLLI